MKQKTHKAPVVSKEFIAAVKAQNKSRALFQAIKAKGEEVFDVIAAVNDGANLNLDFEGKLPLEYAIFCEKFERFKTLSAITPTVGNVADINTLIIVGEKNKVTMTYLHYAATLGLSRIVKYLVGKGLDQTLQDSHPRGLLPIHYAARSGDCATLDALNDNQQALKAISGAGDFCLHIAAETGKIAMVTHLLGLGADINCRDREGRIPLHRAAQRGQKETVIFLLGQKTQITSRNYWDVRGRNSFHYAVIGGHSDLMPLLVLKDDTHSSCDLDGLSAMHMAAENNKVDMMRFLKGKDGLTFLVKDKKGRMPIHIAIEKKAINVFDFLLADSREGLRNSLAHRYKGEQLERAVAIEFAKTVWSWQDEAGDSVIEYAVRGDFTVGLQKLIELGVSLDRANQLGCTPMHEAAKVGRGAMLLFLHNHGLKHTQRNLVGQRPVHIAAEYGQVAVFEVLKGLPNNDFKDKDHEGLQPIHCASCGGKREAIDWLLANNGGTLNDNDNKGRNCLIHAVRSDQVELIGDLVNERKMSLKTVCSKKFGLMHHAVFKRAKKAIFALVELGMSLETPGEKGILPFHVAVQSGLTDMVDFLVAQHVNRNACNELGRNAWFYAAANQGLEMLECLFKHQVTLFGHEDPRGMTPVHIAAQYGNLVALKYFENKGLSCLAEDKSHETPRRKASKTREKEEKELAVMKKSPAYQRGDKEEIERCKAKESLIVNLIDVEGYLLNLERKATAVVVPLPVVPQLKKTPIKTRLRTYAKRDLEEKKQDDEAIRIVKPKKWEPTASVQGDKTRQEDSDNQLATSDQADDEQGSNFTGPKY